MNSEQNLFVYRPLAPSSEAMLRKVQRDLGSLDSFVPVQALHLTILSARSNHRSAKIKFGRTACNHARFRQVVCGDEISKNTSRSFYFLGSRL